MEPSGVEQIVERVFQVAGVPHEPPVPVEELARAMGVNTIRRESMVEDGRLELRDRQSSIFVREGVALARQRFTIAHELGHLVLADPQEDLIARRFLSPGFDAEERFCDAFAAASLLPRHWILSQFRGAPERLTVARQVAASSDTSLSASVLRLRELLEWQRALLHWRRYEGKWRLVSSTGVPLKRRDLRSGPETREILERLRGSEGPHRGSLPLIVGHTTHMVPAELSVRQRVAVALVAL
jgi:Zn-dependent peptidase ImmA (M78 family)